MALIKPTSLWTRRLVVPNLGTLPNPRGSPLITVEEKYVSFLVAEGYGIVVEDEAFNPLILIPPSEPPSITDETPLLAPPTPPTEVTQDDIPVVVSPQEVSQPHEEAPPKEAVESQPEPETKPEEAPVIEEEQSDNSSKWMDDALAFLNSKTAVAISNQISGIGPKKAGELVAARPLTWDAVKRILNQSQQTALETKFGN